MSNRGSFIKGEKRSGQGKRGPGKVPSQARAVLATFADANVDRLQGWLDAVAVREGPAAAFALYVKLLEFVVPKVARRELTGDVANPLKVIVSWMDPA